jgi:hypothetical protein
MVDDREWFQEVDEDLDDEPLEVELVELEELPEYLTHETDDENDPDYEPSECETTDELPSSDDDEKSYTDEETCIGCRHGIANQQAHYGGCIQFEEY